jgi:hypothetical protein
MEETTGRAVDERPLDIWRQRFTALADEARAEGVDVVCILRYEDRFDASEDWSIVRRALPLLGLGLLRLATLRLEQTAREGLTP